MWVYVSTTLSLNIKVIKVTAAITIATIITIIIIIIIFVAVPLPHRLAVLLSFFRSLSVCLSLSLPFMRGAARQLLYSPAQKFPLPASINISDQVGKAGLLRGLCEQRALGKRKKTAAFPVGEGGRSALLNVSVGLPILGIYRVFNWRRCWIRDTAFEVSYLQVCRRGEDSRGLEVLRLRTCSPLNR